MSVNAELNQEITSTSFLKNQAQRQLEALGYKKGDAVRMRYIHPVLDPATKRKRSSNAEKLIFSDCQKYQDEGRDVYFVVNPGGHDDNSITEGRAIFYEHDDIPKEDQLYLWESLRLPEPTIQVDTGGKSIHSYWVFIEPIPVAQWCELQIDLLEFSKGDRTIKNPSRILRLAGSLYMKGKNPGLTRAEIVSESLNKYTYEELRGLIPSSVKQTQPNSQPQADKPVKEPNQGNSKEVTPIKRDGFDIRNFTDKLKPSIPGKFFCPVCGKNDFSFKKENGYYSCYSGGCPREEISKALGWIEEEGSEWKQPTGKNQPPKKKIISPPIPEGLRLVKLSKPATNRPQPTFRPDKIHGQVKEITYAYSDFQFTKRIEWADKKQPKGYDKKFLVFHRNETGEDVYQKGAEPWLSYCFYEALGTIATFNTENPDKKAALLILEGEENVETARAVGLAAITVPGFAAKGNNSIAYAQKMATALKEANLGCLIIIKDNDETGIKRAEAIEQGCAKAGLPCIIIDPLAIHPNLPPKGDIVEILEAMDLEEFIRKLEEEIHRAVAERSANEAKAEAESQKQKEEKASQKIPPADKIAEDIAEKNRDKFAFNNVTSSWMHYEVELPGVWSVESDNCMESIVNKLLKTYGISGYNSHTYITNIVKKLRCELLHRTWDEKSANELLPFRDGVLELATGKLLPHSPDYKFTWALERSHDTNATDWSIIDEFLTHATGG
ncbi:hypothetical protein H6F61_11865, partial [Cyanobacteria bacterium FACHB-472]|nr:hypothetical protein [Cyanobacteria bacterium FACHB-472]